MTEVLHKLNITAEAACDISEGLGLTGLDRRTLKADVEEYITHMSASGRLPWWGYFRADYVDDDSGRRLKLFIYKGDKLGLMQMWSLKGVCFAADWSEDAEDDGDIRRWLCSRLKPPPAEDDWVVRYRVWKILNETQNVEMLDVLEEVKNAFDCERDKDSAEKLALQQSLYFIFTGRRRAKKKG
jgi:hypothetical protein